jgi:hypothetical protein
LVITTVAFGTVPTRLPSRLVPPIAFGGVCLLIWRRIGGRGAIEQAQG